MISSGFLNGFINFINDHLKVFLYFLVELFLLMPFEHHRPVSSWAYLLDQRLWLGVALQSKLDTPNRSTQIRTSYRLSGGTSERCNLEEFTLSLFTLVI